MWLKYRANFNVKLYILNYIHTIEFKADFNDSRI